MLFTDTCKVWRSMNSWCILQFMLQYCSIKEVSALDCLGRRRRARAA